nr:MAG TPA: putative transcriptional regulator [Caudoviricetes sp.]
MKGRQKMKLLKLKEVLEITACGKTKLYAMIKKDEFPRPCKIGSSSRWRSEEVENWIKTRPLS